VGDSDSDIDRPVDETVIHLMGEVDAASAYKLREEIFDLIDSGRVEIVLSLDDVTFIDSSGMAVMLVAAKMARRMGGDVVLRSPRPALLRLLDICGLRTALTVTD
jgi:anti-anti-sigma factor